MSRSRAIADTFGMRAFNQAAAKASAPPADAVCREPSVGQWLLIDRRDAPWSGRIVSRAALTTLDLRAAQRFPTMAKARKELEARPELSGFRPCAEADLPW